MENHHRWTESGNPVLTSREKQALRDYLAVQEDHQAEIQAVTLQMCREHPEFGPIIQAMSQETMEAQNRQSQELSRKAIYDDQWEPLIKNMRDQGAMYARMGITFAGWFDVISSFQSVLIPHLAAVGDAERVASLVLGMTTNTDIAMAVIGDAYLRTKEEIINQQQDAIRELSTPVLQIRDRMLILPIIGVIDTQRARQLTEQLLHAVRAHRARVVVMDITGVAAVDSKVANHLLQTVGAARLMGARVIVTGVSSDVAHALVTLGVDTSQLHTTGDLQSGIEEADFWLGSHLGRSEEGTAPSARA